MSGFDIGFVNEVGDKIPAGHRYGQVRIGDFCERFVSDTRYWAEVRYQKQWLKAAGQSMAGEEKVALLTSIGEPSSANFVRWWAMYREGERVYLQEQICFMKELVVPFDPERADSFVRARQTTTEDGEPISEWYATAADIREFLDRRAMEWGRTA